MKTISGRMRTLTVSLAVFGILALAAAGAVAVLAKHGDYASFGRDPSPAAPSGARASGSRDFESGPENAVDGDSVSAWRPPEGAASSWLVFDFPQAVDARLPGAGRGRAGRLRDRGAVSPGGRVASLRGRLCGRRERNPYLGPLIREDTDFLHPPGCRGAGCPCPGGGGPGMVRRGNFPANPARPRGVRRRDAAPLRRGVAPGRQSPDDLADGLLEPAEPAPGILTCGPESGGTGCPEDGPQGRRHGRPPSLRSGRRPF